MKNLYPNLEHDRRLAAAVRRRTIQRVALGFFASGGMAALGLVAALAPPVCGVRDPLTGGLLLVAAVAVFAAAWFA